MSAFFTLFKKRETDNEKIDNIYKAVAKCDEEFKSSNEGLKNSTDKWYKCMTDNVLNKMKEESSDSDKEETDVVAPPNTPENAPPSTQ